MSKRKPKTKPKLPDLNYRTTGPWVGGGFSLTYEQVDENIWKVLNFLADRFDRIEQLVLLDRMDYMLYNLPMAHPYHRMTMEERKAYVLKQVSRP